MKLKQAALAISLLALSGAALAAGGEAKAELRRAIANDELPRGEASGPAAGLDHHSSATRDAVRQQTAVARANGEMNGHGAAPASEFPQRVQSVASRAEVKQQVALARANGTLDAPGETLDSGMLPHQAHGPTAGSSPSIFALLKKGTQAKDGQ